MARVWRFVVFCAMYSVSCISSVCSWNMEVHFLVHKSPPVHHILSEPNPFTPHLFNIYFNIIPFTSRSPEWFPPSNFATKLFNDV
jgi:hypothetical protein